MSEARLMQGNEACAEAAIAAGVNFFAGYPITPSTEIAETMAKATFIKTPTLDDYMQTDAEARRIASQLL